MPNKLEHLEENIFLRDHTLPNIAQEETGILNITVTIKETKQIIKRTIPNPSSKERKSHQTQAFSQASFTDPLRYRETLSNEFFFPLKTKLLPDIICTIRTNLKAIS